MRPAPGPFPKKLPDIAETARMIQREVVDRPDIRLTDMSIGQLILDLNDGTPSYLAGSHVWLRSIFGIVPRERLDYDVVLSSKESAERFITGTLAVLNNRVPKSHRYGRTANAFGNDRIAMPDGTPIIDAWHLRDDESIHELLMGFPEDYQRSAYHVSHSPTAASLIRMAHVPARRDENDCYPGRRARRNRRVEIELLDDLPY